jgi:hypothetical protein
MKYCYHLILTILMLSMSSAQLASSENQSAGVVYSSDQNPRKAEQEIEQLPRRLPQYRDRVGLFKRRNWYVSVVLFPTLPDARRAQNIIDSEYSRGSFVVNLQEWCRPDWRKNTGAKLGVSYYDCKRGEIIPGRTGAIITNKFSTIKDAKSDLEKLKKNPFQKQQHNLTIFKRGDSYFTAVINYANKEEAKKSIPNGKKFRDVDIKDWCNPSGDPQSGYLAKDDYIQCQNK